MNLIYTVAYGNPEHFQLVWEWAKSIRAMGYTGELILLSDREYEIEGCKTIVCDFMDPSQFWKAAIRRVVRCEDYEKILFLDSDISHLQNPEKYFELYGICIPQEPTLVRKSGLNGAFLTPSEWDLWSNERSYNAGTFLMPGALANEFLTTWEIEWKSVDWSKKKDFWPDTKTYKGQMYDQGILQAMIVRNQFPVMPIPMPDNFVGFPCLRPELGNTVAVHFCGLEHNKSNKRDVLDAMRGVSVPQDRVAIFKNMRLLAHPMAALTDQMGVLVQQTTGYIQFAEAKFKAFETEIKRLNTEIQNMKEPVM